MDLWKKILINGLQNENDFIDFTNDDTLKKVIESESYKILQSIICLINDVNLSDENCFYKIEKILTLLKNNNIFTDRHDFG